MGRKKHTYEYVKDFIENKGYTLLSKEYENTYIKLKVMCPEGHTYEPTFDNFREGHGCPTCNRKGRKKLIYDHVQRFIENEGHILLSTKYENVQTILKIKCPEGHIYELSFNKFQQGQRCIVCSGKQKHTYEYIQTFIENERYTLLSKKYTNINTKIQVRCPEGHIYKTTFNNFQQGYRCPACARISSRSEKEMVEIVKKYYDGTILENDRSVVRNPITGRMLELDVYLPDHKKAIEFNGTFWHSYEEVKQKDQLKIDQCRELGIDLFVIDEQDWLDDKKKCYNDVVEFVTTR